MIYHRGGEPERAMHCWLKCHGTQAMDNSRICHRLLFHERGKQYFVLLRLHTRFNYTSHWSYELSFSHLWMSIMHGFTWSELNYWRDLYCLWARRNLSLALSRSTVVEEDRENSMIIFRIKFEFEVHTCTSKFCKSADLKFPVSGRSIYSQIDRHTCAQCSHASVGLAQARPN